MHETQYIAICPVRCFGCDRPLSLLESRPVDAVKIPHAMIMTCDDCVAAIRDDDNPERGLELYAVVNRCAEEWTAMNHHLAERRKLNRPIGAKT